MTEKTAKPVRKRARASKPVATRRTRTKPSPTPDHGAISVRAYFIHLEGGRDELENWLRAERELTAA